MSASYATWGDALDEFIPRARNALRGTPERAALLLELLPVAREFWPLKARRMEVLIIPPWSGTLILIAILTR